MKRYLARQAKNGKGRANIQATTQLLGTRISLHSYYNAVLVAGGAAHVCKGWVPPGYCLDIVVTPISSPGVQACKYTGANDRVLRK